MGEVPENGPSGLVTYSQQAAEDRAEIFLATVERWGHSRARSYLDFLREVLQRLAAEPLTAPVERDYPGLRSHVVRWQNTRDGHRIYFRVVTDGILVVRILHTSMDHKKHLR